MPPEFYLLFGTNVIAAIHE